MGLVEIHRFAAEKPFHMYGMGILVTDVSAISLQFVNRLLGVKSKAFR